MEQTRSPKAEKAKPKKKLSQTLKTVWKWIWPLRKILMAVPVVLAALRLAAYSMANLPEQVGIGIEASGEYTQLIAREMAVNGPFMVTMGCLLMMFLSRRTVYPWIMSIFSLVLPIVILAMNSFHG